MEGKEKRRSEERMVREKKRKEITQKRSEKKVKLRKSGER